MWNSIRRHLSSVNLSKLKQAVAFVLYAILLYVAARFLISGLDGHASRTAVFVLALSFIFLGSSKRSFFILFPIVTLCSLYTPVGFEYGPPDYQALSSLMATDAKESVEFLGIISLKSYLKALSIPLILGVCYLIAQRFKLQPWRNKSLVIVAVLSLVVLMKPLHFFSSLEKSYKQVEVEKTKLESLIQGSNWSDVTYQGGEKDYVLVIGESVRRDYMHIYGYPVNNTPFIGKAPATIVDGLTAGGTYTIGSLRLMLTKPDKQKWQPDYSLNVMDLANAAGIQTYWISNQGYLGEYDTPVSAIGAKATIQHFVNKSSYDTARHSDGILLNILQDYLSEKTSKKARLFVLHTLGSHPDACQRIEDMDDPYVVNDRKMSYVACYVSSIKYADEFLEKLYGQMKTYQKQSGRPFSILYFADHGMIHREIDGVIYLNNNKASKRHYSIPLLVLDSEASEHKVLNSVKSGLSFTEGLGTWMNITAKQMQHYDLFDGKSDEFDYGLKQRIQAIHEPDDPPIDISDYLRD